MVEKEIFGRGIGGKMIESFDNKEEIRGFLGSFSNYV